MKLKCDLCDSALQMNLGGKSATCTGCGLTYSMDRLKEMLGSKTTEIPNPPKAEAPKTEPPKPKPPKAEPQKPKPPKPETPKGKPQKDIIFDVTNWEKAEPEKEIIYEVTNWEKAEPKKDIVYDVTNWTTVGTPKHVFSFTPLQFKMENSGNGIADLFGLVQQGGIGLGDSVYLDGDYAHPYKVYSINDNADVTCVKEGMAAELFVHIPTRQRKILANARVVTGEPNPVANAYNYPGPVQEYFSKLIASEFPQYELYTNVPNDNLRIPVTFMLYRNNKPLLAVFLIDSNDSKAIYQVKKAARVFAPFGVNCVHFYKNYRNDMPYVIQRVQAALG